MLLPPCMQLAKTKNQREWHVSIAEVRRKGRKIRPGKPGQKAGLPEPLVHHPKPANEYPYPTSKFTPETVEVIVEAVRKGNYFTTASRLAGITVSTLYRWLNQGEAAIEDGNYDDPHAVFYTAIHEAEAEAESGLVATIVDFAEVDYRAGLEILSRRFPDKWSTRSRHELTGEGGGPVELVVVFEDSKDPEDDD